MKHKSNSFIFFSSLKCVARYNVIDHVEEINYCKQLFLMNLIALTGAHY